MTAKYKRKRLIEENCRDIRPTDIRKQLNSSERISAKISIRKDLNSLSSVQEIRSYLEDQQYIRCGHNQMTGYHRYIEKMLDLLGIGKFDIYRCKCVNFDNLSDFEIIQMFDL